MLSTFLFKAILHKSVLVILCYNLQCFTSICW